MNPKNLLSGGLTTLVLVALTLRNSFLSSHEVTDFITLFALISLLTKILQSSAYLTKRSPLYSNSLSNLSKYTFERIGDSGPPYVDKDIMPS